MDPRTIFRLTVFPPGRIYIRNVRKIVSEHLHRKTKGPESAINMSERHVNSPLPAFD
jgi:hypothetical protein